jgi:A/G-specific adenine glycosylase
MPATRRPKTNSPASPAALLLAWYDAHGRDLAWRKKGGAPTDPYHVWLSEIMLQQTTVAAVTPYFHKFLEKWPRVQDLAAATADEVMAAWAGLGYYARARNLHACAKAVAALPGAKFPDTEEGLRALPGIGPYTAAAIAAIAFGRQAAVVDGNIERVIARSRRIETPLPVTKNEITGIVASLTPLDRPGDFAQAMMDLGATVCTPRNPNCALCPWAKLCAVAGTSEAETYPRKKPKPARPLRRGSAFVVVSLDRQVLLRRRPEKGLLGGMYEPPGTPWGQEFGKEKDAPLSARYQKLAGTVRHAFTHFELELEVYLAEKVAPEQGLGVWAPLDSLDEFALPNVMRKVLTHALTGSLGLKL